MIFFIKITGSAVFCSAMTLKQAQANIFQLCCYKKYSRTTQFIKRTYATLLRF
jgi:hypothetical protein